MIIISPLHSHQYSCIVTLLWQLPGIPVLPSKVVPKGRPKLDVGTLDIIDIKWTVQSLCSYSNFKSHFPTFSSSILFMISATALSYLNFLPLAKLFSYFQHLHFHTSFSYLQQVHFHVFSNCIFTPHFLTFSNSIFMFLTTRSQLHCTTQLFSWV